MATLSAALYLSGIPRDDFEEDLQEYYTIASKCLDSPNKLKEEWRSSTPSSRASVDSGYSQSLLDEPMSIVKVKVMENKAVVDFLTSKKTIEDLKNAYSFLNVIDEIENRYYVSLFNIILHSFEYTYPKCYIISILSLPSFCFNLIFLLTSNTFKIISSSSTCCLIYNHIVSLLF